MTTHKTDAENSPTGMSRRQAIGIIGAISALGVTGLASYSGRSTTAGGLPRVAAATLNSASATKNILIPSQTLGTFPLSTILNNSSFFRETINEDKTGIPLSVNVKLINVNDNDTPISGYVYIWHSDNDGLYSGYDADDNPGQSGQTYCRGLQATDSHGQVSFSTIYPGANEGRIPHINLQLFIMEDSSGTSLSARSHMAFPAEVTTSVYNSCSYGKCGNLTAASYGEDHVVSDGITYPLATVTGNLIDGYFAELELGIAIG